ncbi:MAG: nucleotidyltransferase domain-containing protein [Deltaproteobacteria bacterium]|nr:nucleotidyltransferase domain-containing protein [Deltaproteobacteria bacterium]
MVNKLYIWKGLFSTPKLKVLDFLLQNSDLKLNDTEITARVKGVGRSAVNMSLRELTRMGLVERTVRGNMVMNRLIESPFIHTMKIASNILHVQELVEHLKPQSSKIILFGSRAVGDNTSESDSDLFVVSETADAIFKIARKFEEKLQIVVKSSAEWLSLPQDNSVFYETIRKGILLWEQS